MSGSTRAGLAALLLVVVWIVVYWRTAPAGGGGGGGGTDGAGTGRDLIAGDRLVVAGEGSGAGAVMSVPGPVLPITSEPVPAPTAIPAVESSPAAAGPVARLSSPLPGSPLSAPPPTSPSSPVPDKAKPGETIPPTFDLYEIQAGDNAQVISKKKYGTTKHWRAILKANPLLDFTRLRPGRVIKVPHDPENTQGVVVPSETGDYVEYTVASGDTLMGISQALYGKSGLWRTILDANPHLDGDATNLRVGMKLKVPPPGKGAGSGTR